mmetsp:Transcript_11666/g.34961  ORF Transcript_11666/g.34961 Transcript_11666/m.34961 type:complete len:211 (+) Transcript_11666:83-715(+)
MTRDKPPLDPWAESVRRFNVLVMAELRDIRTSSSFAVATYHMPCLFGSLEKEQVMYVHAAAAAKLTKDFAAGLPFVFAGDFNIKPHDPAYAMLTAATVPPMPSVDHVNLHDFFFSQNGALPLVSAYAAFGKEPEVTNFAFNKFQTEPFCDTLDYIFLGGTTTWKVLDVKPTPAKADLDLAHGSFPDPNQPSDHVPIAADLQFEFVSSSSS